MPAPTSRTALFAAGAALAALAAIWWLRTPGGPDPAPGAPRAPVPEPAGPPIDAARIASGRLALERMPAEVGSALETFSDEIVRNAEALEGKQARITGTCAPGSAIRVIAEDGTVSCQRLPRGVVSVAALAATPRLASTTTAPATVPGGIGRFQTGGEDDFLVVPVALPDGAIVTSFTFVYWDSSEEVDGAAWLYRSDDQPLAAVTTSGASSAVRMGTSEQIQQRRVDAGRYAYFVYFQVSAAARAALLPISASVAYRLP